MRIVGLMITDRIKEAGRMQLLLTKYAAIIRSRLGFHEVSEDRCSRTGVIILQMIDKKDLCDRFEQEVSMIGGVELQKMTFSL